MDIEKITFNLKGNTKVLLNKSDGKRIIAGYANVAIIDLENQYIPLAVLQKGIQSLLKDPSYANLMIMHKNIQIGKIIPSYGKYKTGVDTKGLYIVCEIRKDISVADEIWSSILKKEISGFSIGCEVLLSHKVCDDKECVTILDKINIFEVSVCTEPVNQKSGFTVISKSDYEKFKSDVNVLNVDNIGIENMADEIKKDATPCTNCTEPIELSIEERLESLEKLAKNINDFMELAKKKPEEEVPPTPCKDEKKADPVPPFPPVEQPTGEQPVTPPEEEKPEEMDMAVFMLDYIIRNPKSTAQDIAKAWMKKSQKSKSFTATEQVPVPVVSPQDPVMESLMKKVDTLSEKISKLDYTEELKSSLKVRDDAIQALEKKIEIINKSKEPEKKVEPEVKQEIKTVQAITEPVMEIEPAIRVSNGTVTSSEFM
jgi:HK97 family phage prohead protease